MADIGSNVGSSNPLEHPVQAAQSVLGKLGIDPRMEQRMRTLMNMNDGPAKIAARVTGVQGTHVEQDKDPYFTNNEGIPWPDPAHTLNVGGIPVISDTFLLQKQQTFNRSKTLERKFLNMHIHVRRDTYDCVNGRHGASVWKWCVWVL